MRIVSPKMAPQCNITHVLVMVGVWVVVCAQADIASTVRWLGPWWRSPHDAGRALQCWDGASNCPACPVGRSVNHNTHWWLGDSKEMADVAARAQAIVKRHGDAIISLQDAEHLHATVNCAAALAGAWSLRVCRGCAHVRAGVASFRLLLSYGR